MSASEIQTATVQHHERYAAHGWLARTLPGVLLTAIIAVLATALHHVPGLGSFSSLILSILLGMAFHNVVGTPRWAKAGVTFSLRRILRGAIILLGLQLTVTQIATVGMAGVAGTGLTLGATFFFTLWAGRRLGVDRALSTLIATGTSICGASAVVAANAVVDGGDEDVAYAIATVTVFGSLSMVLFPSLDAALHLAPHVYGLWSGASIHEIAQVVAAAFQEGQDAGHFGTIVKLTRVLMLAPVVLLLAWFWDRNAGNSGARRKGTTPWFAFGFLLMVGVNSVLPISAGFHQGASEVTTFLLAMALAAMGLETDIARLRAKGLRPLALGASAWIFITAFGLAMAVLAM
ncbi:YeiH family protein [Parvibaculum sp.]|uniref:YeiH family protein n=1 Tax=Parvibaculum sp. TaxID=2024848 RepID=UPI003210EB9F